MGPDPAEWIDAGGAERKAQLSLAIAGANSSAGRNLLNHIAADKRLAAVAGVRTQRAAETLPASENIRPATVSYEDIDGLAAVLAGADCAVHLAGVLFESRAGGYLSANVASTRAVIEASCRAGVKHIVFVSALGADAESDNPYLRSKGEAERALTESGLAATIIRTPMLLSPDSAAGLALYRQARQGRVALLAGGRHRVRPLDGDDLSRAILAACHKPAGGVVTHELVGPEALSYAELLRRAAAMLGGRPRIVSVPLWCAKLAAGVSHRLRGAGISPAVIDVITSDEVVSQNGDKALGLRLSPLTATLRKLVARSGAEQSPVAQGG